MTLKKGWIVLGGCLCMTAAFVAQRVLGQGEGLPGLPPPPVGLPAPPSLPSTSNKVALPPITPTQFTPPSTMESTLPSLPTIPAPSTLPTIPTPGALPPIPTPGTLPPIPQPGGTQQVGVNPANVLKDTQPALPGLPLTPLATMPANEANKDVANLDHRVGKQDSQISIEWVAPSMIHLNQPSLCQLLVNNNGNAAVHNVIVRHKLAPNTSLKTANPMPMNDAGSLVWNLGSMGGGQKQRIELQLIASQRGPMSTVATVAYTSGTKHNFQVREPLLQVKIKTLDKVVVGESAQVVATISNPGDGPTENIKIRVNLPEGLDHPKGRSFEEFGGTLEPNQSRSMTFAVTTRLPGIQPITLLATALGGINTTDSANVEVLMPKLDLAFSGPKFRFVDRPAKYSARISNPSPAPVTNIVLTEQVPAGVKYVNASDSGKFEETTRQVTWNLGELQPGQIREVNFEVVASTTGEHVFGTQVTGSRGVKAESALKLRVEQLSSLNLEVAATENPIEVNTDTTFQIRVANSGTKIEENIELHCSLPGQVQYISANNTLNTQVAVQQDGSVVFQPVPRLAPRAEVIYYVTVKGKVAGDARFRAQIRATGIAENLSREEVVKIYND